MATEPVIEVVSYEVDGLVNVAFIEGIAEALERRWGQHVAVRIRKIGTQKQHRASEEES